MIRAVKIFIFGLVMIASLTGAYADPIDKTLADLHKNMQNIHSIQADFLQSKQMQIFSKPLLIKGSLYLQKPNKFSWRTKTPMKYNMVLVGNTVKQWDAEARQVQEFSLAKNPAFEAAMAQMKSWFDGDYAVLQKDYDVAQTAAAPLALAFTPKASSPAFGLIDKVIVIFREDKRYIAHIEIREKNSDTTTIDFLNTKIDVPIASWVWEVKKV